MEQQPFILGVGGVSSNVGKTTLVCELLRALPGWEAIKTTRGHYRSCGKDPRACCVSHLLSDVPLVRSGRDQTYEAGKDTGRYWDAGAANVHWLIATNEQVESGIREALSRVKSKGVIIEGNSFSEYVAVNLMAMVARTGVNIKRSAKKALAHCRVLYLEPDGTGSCEYENRIRSLAPSAEIIRAPQYHQIVSCVLQMIEKNYFSGDNAPDKFSSNSPLFRNAL
jgi:molybdopterin-guanine dinucleotide biosynthesis protein